ncbi:MAG TPA: RNA polymerase sigma factor [Nannocystis exedens]|nr:RNA polymerase sigma factor [Nannocystis exedens]
MSERVARQAASTLVDGTIESLGSGEGALASSDAASRSAASLSSSSLNALNAEERLVARAKVGDKRALREIHDAYQSQVRAHLHRLLGSDPDIDDMVQIVFVRAFSALGRFRGSSSLATWLYRITANSTHNLLRQRYRRNRLKAAVHWFNQGRKAHVSDASQDTRQQAESLLEHLHPDLRQVFVLYHYQGLTLHEIADVFEKPISTIGDRLSRARKRLQSLVQSQ